MVDWYITVYCLLLILSFTLNKKYDNQGVTAQIELVSPNSIIELRFGDGGNGFGFRILRGTVNNIIFFRQSSYVDTVVNTYSANTTTQLDYNFIYNNNLVRLFINNILIASVDISASNYTKWGTTGLKLVATSANQIIYIKNFNMYKI